MKKGKRWIVAGVVVAAAVAAVLLWPAPDPLRGVDTVALRLGNELVPSAWLDWESELRVVLGRRDIRIVSDEWAADAVLALTDLQLRLGDVQVNFSNGSVSGRASAVCRITDVRTGRSQVMDFVLRISDGKVRADLVGRRFWEFWKPQPGK